MKMKIKAPLILASKSPRRKELFEKLGFPFTIQTIEVDEVYPKNHSAIQIVKYLSRIKSEPIALKNPNAIVIGVDTIVFFENKIYGKPHDTIEAKNFLIQLNGKIHQVISGVTLFYQNESYQFHDVSKVHFQDLDEYFLDYYIENYQPLDKAGAYGIQDFWGLVGVKKIEGDFYNVMGLPVTKLFQHFLKLGWIE